MGWLWRGDLDERRKPISGLSHPDADTRVRALRDTHYLADWRLAAHFQPALEDQRDVTAISGPHEVPLRFARVCDVAVQAMAVLGLQLSFGGRILERHNEQRIAEAIAMVRALSQ